MAEIAESGTQEIKELTVTAIPRRTLVAGAAWSVPAIAFAGAAPAFAGASQCGPGDSPFYPTTEEEFSGWAVSGGGTELAAVQNPGGAYLTATPGFNSSVNFTVNFNWATLIPNLGGVCNVSVFASYRVDSGASGTFTLRVAAGGNTFNDSTEPTTFTQVGGLLTNNPTTPPASVTVTALRGFTSSSLQFRVDYVRVALSYWVN